MTNFRFTAEEDFALANMTEKEGRFCRRIPMRAQGEGKKQLLIRIIVILGDRHINIKLDSIKKYSEKRGKQPNSYKRTENTWPKELLK